MSNADGLKVFDPRITTPTDAGCGTLAAAGIFYSKVIGPREACSFVVQMLGPLAGNLKIEVSNTPKDDKDAATPGSRWSLYTDIWTAGVLAIATAQRVVDTDDLEFVPFIDAAPDLTVRVATAAALPACTASGTGVGKTLTASAVGILTVNGVALVLNERVLVKNQQNPRDNGVYKVTTAGTAGVAFILTRATDNDTDAEMVTGTSVVATAGDARTWVLAAPAININLRPCSKSIRLRFDCTTAVGQVIADAYTRGN